LQQCVQETVQVLVLDVLQKFRSQGKNSTEEKGNYNDDVAVDDDVSII
jgi:hypothetical protein